jgi:hypothetical protein
MPAMPRSRADQAIGRGTPFSGGLLARSHRRACLRHAPAAPRCFDCPFLAHRPRRAPARPDRYFSWPERHPSAANRSTIPRRWGIVGSYCLYPLDRIATAERPKGAATRRAGRSCRAADRLRDQWRGVRPIVRVESSSSARPCLIIPRLARTSDNPHCCCFTIGRRRSPTSTGSGWVAEWVTARSQLRMQYYSNVYAVD